MSKVKTRFAPSPTGHLHIGGARTALFSWLLARHNKGEFYLRIEDTDLERSKQEYTDSILASLSWLGLNYEGEPIYQSQRSIKYAVAVETLIASGHAYWCSCPPEAVEQMREEAKAKGLKPRYDGSCRDKNIGPGSGKCVRLKTPLIGKVGYEDLAKGYISVDVTELDDMVIQRSDGMATYNLAVVVDDHDMGITHVLRGDDHVSNTLRQILIFEALGYDLPQFGHVPMILGPDKQKLSKRHGARATIEYEQDGLLPEALVNYLARLGWSHKDQEIFTMHELIELFNGENLSASASAFDPDKLQWLNAHYLRALNAADLAKKVLPFIQALGFEQVSLNDLEKIAPLFQERSTNLKELAQSLQVLLIKAQDLTYEQGAIQKVCNEQSLALVGNFANYYEALEILKLKTLKMLSMNL